MSTDLEQCWDSLSRMDLLFVGHPEKRSILVSGDSISYTMRRLSYDSVMSIERECKDNPSRRSVMFIMASVESFELFAFEDGLALCKGLLTVHPSVWNSLVESVMSVFSFDEKELLPIRKDFSMLYSPNTSAKSTDRRVSRYLTLCAFWDKLGLNMFDLQRIPYSEYLMLSYCMSLEAEAKERERKRIASQSKSQRGKGGPR